MHIEALVICREVEDSISARPQSCSYNRGQCKPTSQDLCTHYLHKSTKRHNPRQPQQLKLLQFSCVPWVKPPLPLYRQLTDLLLHCSASTTTTLHGQPTGTNPGNVNPASCPPLTQHLMLFLPFHSCVSHFTKILHAITNGNQKNKNEKRSAIEQPHSGYEKAIN